MIPDDLVVAIAVVAVLLGPATVVSRRAFWHAVMEGHPVALGVLAFIAIVPAAAVALAIVAPRVALVVGWATIGATIVSAVLSRPGRGARAGWPPGSLGWWGSVVSLIDPAEYARRARRHGEVFKIRQMHRPTVCVVDLAEGTRLLVAHRERLGPATLPFNDRIPGGFVRYLRGEEHRSRRAALQQAFNRRAIGAMESSLRASLRAGVTTLVDAEPWHPRAIEWPILHAMIVAYLGPGASGAFRESTADLVQGLASGSERDLRALMAALPEEAAEPSIMASLSGPTGDAVDDSEAEREKVIANAAYMLHLGWRDLSGFAAWVVLESARRPGLMESVRARPELAAHVIEETLRLRQSEYLYRKALVEIPLKDHIIPKGWLVRVCVREAHRSADYFREPGRFDPERFDEGCPYGPPDRERFAPFGVDHHGCIGADLSRTVGRILVEELARHGLEVVRDAPAAVGGRHWRHVAPGRRTLVRLTRRP